MRDARVTTIAFGELHVSGADRARQAGTLRSASNQGGRAPCGDVVTSDEGCGIFSPQNRRFRGLELPVVATR